MDSVKIKLISSLEKVFSGDELIANERKNGSMLKNEIYSFQLAVKGGSEDQKAKIEIDSPLAKYIKVYNVGEVPSDLPAYDNWKDDDYIKTMPGLYPDILFDNNELEIDITPNKWISLWFAVEGNESLKAGEYLIKIILENKNGESIANTEYALEVIDKILPKQKLLHTEWLYLESLSAIYKTEMFSERLWTLLESYLKTAVKYGQNMLLTPIFTPPFFTDPGKERPVVQLVDVFVNDGQYSFNFDRLKRWIELAKSCGMEYFEFSHLYSQWEIKNTPIIFAAVNGEYKKIFDSHSISTGDEYTNFVIKFLKELTIFLIKEKINDKCYFHIADEPRLDSLEIYKAAANTMKSVLKNDYKIIDALSDYDFYETGAVEIPIPSSDHMEKFLENNIKNLWTYYCCQQGVKVSNRFMAMPSYRSRILATQLYKFDIAGFLHWGFNYWMTYFGDIVEIDPFHNTDSCKSFPSGDAFLVYPGEDGPVLSLRILVLNEALQDLRAFQLLERLTSRDEVLELIEQGCKNELTFSEYPRSSDYILNLRAQVNERLKRL